MTPSSSKSPMVDKTTAQGRLLANLTAAFYVLFTLLPNSNSLMVVWPFVFIWQIALLTPMLWLLWQIGLGRRWRGLNWYLDAIAVASIVGLFASNLGAVFPNQAHWYGWAALGILAAIYALNHWLLNPDDPALIEQRRKALLIKQGYLSFAFILVSLFTWLSQTLLPYFSQLEKFKQAGVNIGFSFSVLELRNWAPIGHQNYVAGYLILALPLFCLLAFSTSGKRRIFWLITLVLGLINLYTTSSRGGGLAFIFFIFWGLIGLAIQEKINRRLLLRISLGITSLLVIIIVTNDRFKSSLNALLQGQGSGESTYRLLNNLIGWLMGSSHPFTGIGLGGVSLNYQKYRPFWAGRESEITYQLHSTPAQLFAEMGVWGILILVMATGGLGYFLWQWLKKNSKSSANFIPVWIMSGALFSYGIISLTDYQLDNLSISGFLVIYSVSLVSYQSSQNLGTEANSRFQKMALPLTYGGLALTLAVIVWLFPIQRAWQLSSLGFTALSEKKFPLFVDYLTKANQLVPWESYYPFQLGWNLGDIALNAPNQTERSQLTQAAIAEFEKGINVSPYQEFAYNNLGWLNISIDPQLSSQSFVKALTLFPAKRGLFYGLGVSLLLQQKNDLAIKAFSLECLRDPLFITSPFWRGQLLQRFYPQILTQLKLQLNEFLKEVESQSPKNSDLITFLHQVRGGLAWWQGDLIAAQTDLNQYGSAVSQALLAIAQDKQPDLNSLPSFTRKIITAWNKPHEQSLLLQQAWIEVNQSFLPPELEQQLLLSMQEAKDFKQWLTQISPVLQYRRERSGFGVVSRHIDGVNPKDFFLVVENLPMTTWFSDLFPSPIYDPELDKLLQPEREKLWQKIQKN